MSKGRHALRSANHIGTGLPDQTSSSPGSSCKDSIVMHGRLAPVLGTLLLHVAQVLVEDDAALACERDEALAAGAADQREVGLAGELHSPGGEARARDQD